MNAGTPWQKRGPDIAQASDGRRMGAILVDSGKLRIEDAERVLLLQKEAGCRFGEAALQLGLVTETDIQHALASQFDYAYLEPHQGNLSPELIAAYEPSGPRVEALRALRSQLLLRWLDSDAEHKSLAVVSPNAGDGRSFLAANLAVVFSQLGERTLLIEADLRGPRLRTMFQLHTQYGLSTLLAGRCDLPQAMEAVTGLDRLHVLPAGVVPPNPADLLARPGFPELVRQCAEAFDVILFDTPPGSYADTQVIGSVARAAVLTTRQNQTRLSDARAVIERLREARTRIVGTVLSSF